MTTRHGSLRVDQVTRGQSTAVGWREKLAPGSAQSATVILGESCHLCEPRFPLGKLATQLSATPSGRGE